LIRDVRDQMLKIAEKRKSYLDIVVEDVEVKQCDDYCMFDFVEALTKEF